MSIIAVAVNDQRAAVAVDTQTAFPNGASCETSKFHFLAHLNTVVAGRGTRRRAGRRRPLAAGRGGEEGDDEEQRPPHQAWDITRATTCARHIE